ncbi:MAG: hypothetical protein M5U34_05370 [Chloroflexi bacterium]|nr:hypothetical protein [Chloroflexota bacterium]
MPRNGHWLDAEPISKTVMVNDMPYLAEGYSTLETDDGVWHGEFLDLRLEDGTRLAFGGGFGGQTTREAYAALEQVLLRIVNSYMPSTATTPVGWRSYEDAAANFTIAYPQTWEILPAYREGQTIFRLTRNQFANSDRYLAAFCRSGWVSKGAPRP